MKRISKSLHIPAATVTEVETERFTALRCLNRRMLRQFTDLCSDDVRSRSFMAYLSDYVNEAGTEADKPT